MNRKFKRTAFIWNVTICNIINVFTLTFDASLLNKSIYFKSINTDIITSEESREEHNTPLRSDHWFVPQQHYPWPHNWHECELQTERDKEVIKKKTLNCLYSSIFILIVTQHSGWYGETPLSMTFDPIQK